QTGARAANRKSQCAAWAKAMRAAWPSAQLQQPQREFVDARLGVGEVVQHGEVVASDQRLAHRYRGRTPLVADELVLPQELVALLQADHGVERAARPREKRRAQA